VTTNGELEERLNKAACASFNKDELNRLVEFKLDQKLEAIVDTEQGLETIVFHLVGWAMRNYRLLDLVREMAGARPNSVDLNSIAKELSVRGADQTRVFTREIRIDIPEVALQRASVNEVPPEAQVFGDASSLHLFGLHGEDKGYSWSDFYKGMDSMSDNTAEWVGELAQMMRTIAFSSAESTSTGLALFRYRKAETTQVFRPAIRQFRREQGLLSFSVLFTDIPQETTTEPPGAAAISLAQALMLARMQRWGVMKPFENRVEALSLRERDGRLTHAEWSAAIARELEHFVVRRQTVMVEGRNRGYQREALRGYFTGGRLRKLNKIFHRWDELWDEASKLAGSFRDRVGTKEDIRKLIQECLEQNKQLMVLCAARYLEALREL
jgi:hypothetical protein